MSRKLIYVLATLLALIVVAYFVGPTITLPTYTTTLPEVPEAPAALDDYLREREAAAPERTGHLRGKCLSRTLGGARAIGERIGRRVIIVSTSTGGDVGVETSG